VTRLQVKRLLPPVGLLKMNTSGESHAGSKSVNFIASPCGAERITKRSSRCTAQLKPLGRSAHLAESANYFHNLANDCNFIIDMFSERW
jgi:hypothetical protein